MRRLRGAALLWLAVLPAVAGAAIVEFTAERWELKDAEVTEYLGRSALSGTAWLKETEFGNGVIEVDIAAARERGYPAVVFRKQAEGEFEHIYLRPHRAGLYADALQYAPTFNGVGAWQLYSGPGFTAPVSLPENQWVHLRIEVRGTQARVFVGGQPEPALVIDKLQRGPGRGALGLQSPRGGSARFSHFSVTARDDLAFQPPMTPEPLPGIVTEWSLSPTGRPFALGPEPYLDGKTVSTIAWIKATSEASGLVDVSRFRPPNRQGGSKVWARTVITAKQKETRAFRFGYSDDVTLYLNGQKVFEGQSGYQRRDPSFLGIIGWNDTVFLPLEAGDNELVLKISDQFGGWGFMVRDLSAIYRDPRVTEAWEHACQLAAPESVTHDAKRSVLYVSNFAGDSIAKLTLTGEVIAAQWVGGLKSPTGLKFHHDRLYAIARGEVVEIDPDTGAVATRTPITGSVFPNDLAIDDTGAIYVTDSFKSCIHRIAGGKSEVWLESKELSRPNGLLAEPGRLLVGVTEDAALKAVDLQTKAVTTFATISPEANMDGLVSDGGSGYLFSDYFGRLYHANAQGRPTLLLERRGPQQYCADFDYLPAEKLLVIPSLYENRVTAYRWEPERK